MWYTIALSIKHHLTTDQMAVSSVGRLCPENCLLIAPGLEQKQRARGKFHPHRFKGLHIKHDWRCHPTKLFLSSICPAIQLPSCHSRLHFSHLEQVMHYSFMFIYRQCPRRCSHYNSLDSVPAELFKNNCGFRLSRA